MSKRFVELNKNKPLYLDPNCSRKLYQQPGVYYDSELVSCLYSESVSIPQKVLKTLRKYVARWEITREEHYRISTNHFTLQEFLAISPASYTSLRIDPVDFHRYTNTYSQLLKLLNQYTDWEYIFVIKDDKSPAQASSLSSLKEETSRSSRDIRILVWLQLSAALDWEEELHNKLSNFWKKTIFNTSK